MKKNVGGFDRVARIVVGLGLLSLFFILEGNDRYWGLIGIPLILTALIKWCPPYSLLGISTNKESSEENA